MPAIRERWFADDYELTDGDVMDVEYRDGTLVTPAARGSNVVVNNRTGEQWRPKRHGPCTFTLQVWLGTYQRQAQQLWDDLLAAVVQPHRLVTWRRITAAGESRYCYGEVVGALQPTAIGQAAYRASIDVVVPGGYWRGDQLQVVTVPAGADPAGTVIDLGAFSSSTAMLEELSLTLTGRLVSPQLSDITDRGRGDWVSYNGVVDTGQGLTLNNATWGITGSGGLVPDGGLVNYSGDRFLALAATPPGVKHQLLLTATEIDPGAAVTVSGYRSYLV